MRAGSGVAGPCASLWGDPRLLPAICQCCGGQDGGEDTDPPSRVQLPPGTRHPLTVAGCSSQGFAELTAGYPPLGEGCSEMGGRNQCEWEWSSAKLPGRTSLCRHPSQELVSQGGQDGSRGQTPKMVPLASRGDGWQGDAGKQAVAGWQLPSPLPEDPHAAPRGPRRLAEGAPPTGVQLGPGALGLPLWPQE